MIFVWEAERLTTRNAREIPIPFFMKFDFSAPLRLCG